MIGGMTAGPDSAGPDSAGPDSAGPGGAGPGGGPDAVTVDSRLRRMADWPARRSLGPTSLSGVSLVLAVCAATWFTAATRSADLNGAVALGVCYLAALSARHVASQARGYLADSLEQLTRAARQATGTVPQRARAAARQAALAVRLESIVRWGWLAILGARLSDGVVLAGLAAGAAAQGWPGMWPLAISVLALIAIRDTMTACSRPPEPDPADPDPAEPEHAGRGWLDVVPRAVGAALTMPFGGRVLLLVVAVPVWGARAGLLGLLDWGIIAIGYGIGAGTVARRQGRKRTSARRSRRSRREPGGLAVLLEPPRPPEWAELHAERSAAQHIPVLGIRLSPAAPGSAPPADLSADLGADLGAMPAEPAGGLANIGLAGTHPADLELTDPELTEYEYADPELTDPELTEYEYADAGLADAGLADVSPGLAVIVRCRDDGVISRWFGRLVRGQLLPLPAALLALAGVALLAHLGLGDLPGILILAPAIVMLVAAPGSSHSHAGRLDWLVPAVLQGAQYIYITALGMAAGVPVAVTFLLCTAIALRYADLGCPVSPPLPPRRRTPSSQAAPPAPAQPAATVPERGTWMGWEGRMLSCGLGAAMGIAVFAYIALAAYVGGLICLKILTSCLVVREGDSR